jgi:hypothetical protein
MELEAANLPVAEADDLHASPAVVVVVVVDPVLKALPQASPLAVPA